MTADGRVVDGVGRRERRPVLGAPRRRRQLRHRHRVHLQLHPVGPIVLGGHARVARRAMAGDVVRFWRDFMTTAPDEVGSGARVHHRAAGRRSCPNRCAATRSSAASCCYAGDREEGERVHGAAARVRSAAARPRRADALHRGAGAHRPRRTRTACSNYWSADFLAELPDEAIDTLVEHATQPGVTVQRRSSSSPVAARSPACRDDATAFGERTAPFNTHYLSMWEDPADDERTSSTRARSRRR